MAGKANGPNWRKIKAEYIRGGISQQKLADKYKVPYGTLHRKALLEKWTALKKEAEQKADQKLTEVTADSRARAQARLIEMQNEAVFKLYEKLLHTIDIYPSGAGTKIVTEKIRVQTVEAEDGHQKKVPLKTMTITDIESIARSMTNLGRIYGIDAGSLLEKQRLTLKSNVLESEDVQDDGFIEALNACTDAWTVEDEPENINDSDDGAGDD